MSTFQSIARNTAGFLFESLVIRDLRIYAQVANATVYHYRDSSGREADAIVQDRAGRWCAVEVKLGQSQIDRGAESLKRCVETIDTSKIGEPAALIVITLGDVANRGQTVFWWFQLMRSRVSTVFLPDTILGRQGTSIPLSSSPA